MALHKADSLVSNPRIQCSVCGKWKRQYNGSSKPLNRFNDNSNFYGGCSFNNGNHLAGDHIEVCVSCCDTACKQLSETKSKLRQLDASL